RRVNKPRMWDAPSPPLVSVQTRRAVLLDARQKKRGADAPLAEHFDEIELLDLESLVGELAADAVEQTREAVTQRGRSSDDADRDERGNQAVFNRGRTRLVIHETSDSLHNLAPCTRSSVTTSFDT